MNTQALQVVSAVENKGSHPWVLTRVRVHPSLAFEWVNYTLVRCPWQYTKKVLSCPDGRKKFTVAKTSKIHYNSSMKFEKDSKMTALHRSELLELIVEHAENQGLLSSAYQAKISIMSDQELAIELYHLECTALSYFDMPSLEADPIE